MNEPISPDTYWIVHGTIEVDGKRGYGKVKKWWDADEEKYKERILTFDAYKEEKKC